MDDRQIHKKLLTKFTPYSGYSVDNYYGVAYMKYKKNNQHQLRLIHDYGKHSILSTPITFDSFETCMKILAILEKYSNDGSVVSLDDELEDMLKDNA